MTKKQYTYQLKLIIIALAIWELLFWAAYFMLTYVLGNTNQHTDKLMFKYPSVLLLLYILVPIIGVYLYSLWKHNAIGNKTNERVLQALLRPVSTMSSFLRYFFFRNAFVFLIIALAQPIYGKKKVAGTSESLELVVALDVSNSMNTCDISKKTSRLEISKRALTQLVNSLHGEKIGICIFANSAFVQLPLTRDYSAAKLFIQDIESSMISSQGTNIAAALEVSADMFSDQITSKGIILVTDGENHESDAEEILGEIKKSNIQLSVLGIGTKKGGLIPKNPRRPEIGYKTDAQGRTVISKLNPNFIKTIAQKGGGKASISSSEFPNLSVLLTQISRMKRTKIDTLEFDVKKEQYQIPLFVSIVCWLTFVLWSSGYIGLIDKLLKR